MYFVARQNLRVKEMEAKRQEEIAVLRQKAAEDSQNVMATSTPTTGRKKSPGSARGKKTSPTGSKKGGKKK